MAYIIHTMIWFLEKYTGDLGINTHAMKNLRTYICTYIYIFICTYIYIFIYTHIRFLENYT